MNPEIKSAIEHEAHKASIQVAERFSEGFEICVHDVVKTANYRFKDGAEYGYKLAERQIEDSERNYREMFKTMTASVDGHKASLNIAVTALKAIINHELYEGVNQGADTVTLAQRALKELGE